MTDALACWALRQHEKTRDPWGQLEEVIRLSTEDFGAWINDQRREKTLRDDDVTLMGIR
jgi:hypothetical protein